jgi:hypothetical protein
MKLFKLIFALLLLLASAAGQNAWADRGYGHYGHARVGVSVGVPLGWPWWYEPAYPIYYPYYSYRPIIVEPGPTEYIERGQSQGSDSPASNYWYYCHRPDGYYPYVKECPGGWERVTPQPVPPPR